MKCPCIFYLFMCYSGVFLCFKYIFNSNCCCRATTTVVILQHLSSKLKFSVLCGRSRFCRRLVPKTYGQIRKAYLIGLAAKKVMWNHCMQITIAKIHGECTRAVTLTIDILPFGTKLDFPDLDGIWRLSYEELCHLYAFIILFVTSRFSNYKLMEPPL